MGQFRLTWDNSAVLSNPNATGQRTNYRKKSTGGAFITTGFTPANDLPKTATTADSPVLLDNTIYEFKVQSLCSVSGPTDNDNGIQEELHFVAINPTLTKTQTTATASISVTELDITKARMTLKKTSDNSVAGTQSPVPSAGVISATISGLTANTAYYFQIELYTNLNNVETISSVYGPYPVTTDPVPTCAAVTGVNVDSIEI